MPLHFMVENIGYECYNQNVEDMNKSVIFDEFLGERLI